ncbi:MAG: haloacid dehalogenase-like hydrolase [Thermoplasmatota archaeon]
MPSPSRFDLVTVDLDGTLLPDDTAFAAVLRGAGRGDDVADSDRRFFAGEITLEECFWEQWAWVQELSLQACHRHLRAAAWLPGIAEGVRALKAAGLEVRLLTDQPSSLAEFAGRWGFAPPLCSPVEVDEGRQVAVEARFDKWANLREHLESHGVDPARVAHVGNGSNDVPVWEHTGAGVAVFAEPDVAAAATVDLGRPEGFDAVTAAVLELAGADQASS